VVTPEFSVKAKISIEAAGELPIKTAGGSALADLGYANTIMVGTAVAQGVPIAVFRGFNDPFGHHQDGPPWDEFSRAIQCALVAGIH
jgi:hypothetical protein